MFNTRKTNAEIIEIISCVHQSALVQDYERDYLIESNVSYDVFFDRMYYLHRLEKGFVTPEPLQERKAYQEGNERWIENQKNYREISWYEIRLKVGYSVAGIQYESIIDVSADSGSIKKIKIYYEKTNPHKIVRTEVR